MGERPIGLGKVAENGTLNENGAFYSVQDINVLLEEKGGGSSGGDLPTPTVADAGSVVVVDEQGKYALGEGCSCDLPTPTVADAGSVVVVDAEGKYTLGEAGGNSLHVVMTSNGVVATLDKTYNEIIAGLEASKYVYLTEPLQLEGLTVQYVHTLNGYATNGTDYYSVGFKDYTFESTSADGVLSMNVTPGN